MRAFLMMWLGGPFGLLWLVALQAAPLPAALGPLVRLGGAASMLLGLWLFSGPVWLFLLILRREYRSMSLAALAGGLLSLASWHVPLQQRRVWLQQIAARGDRLAARLEAERLERGFYPVELVDAKLATGAAGYASFSYWPDPDHGFELSLSTPSGGINFDRMFYWPCRTYPDSLHGQPLEKMGNWVYLHE